MGLFFHLFSRSEFEVILTLSRRVHDLSTGDRLIEPRSSIAPSGFRPPQPRNEGDVMARRRGRGFRRQVQRKFVLGSNLRVPADDKHRAFQVDLLAGFRGQPGATHLGATVTRIRGVIYPELSTPLEGPSSSAGLASGSTAGTRTRRSSPTSRKSSLTRTGWAGCPTSLTGLRLPTLERGYLELAGQRLGCRHQVSAEARKSSTRRCGC